jgi:hypothetical protein
MIMNNVRFIAQPCARNGFPELLRLRELDWVDPDVRDEHFPSVASRTEAGVNVAFDYSLFTTEVLARLHEERLRAMTARELLCIEPSPYAYEGRAVLVALGQQWSKASGLSYVLALMKHGSRNGAMLAAITSLWLPGTQFAAVKIDR